jgi:hypothetical protein
MTLSPHDLARVTQCMAAFPADVIGQIVLASSDLCLLVGADLRVLDYVAGYGARDIDCALWQGQSLRALVGPEGQGKIDQLWSAKAQAPTPARSGWRHLNFRAHGVPTEMPLLVQRIAAHDGRSVLVCRDLRPSVQMQQQFNRAILEIERGYLQVPQAAAQAPMVKEQSAQAKALVQQAFGDLGAAPLAQIVQRSALVLEEMCIRKALDQCGYDMAQAAQVLYMEADDLAQRMVFFDASRA